MPILSIIHNPEFDHLWNQKKSSPARGCSPPDSNIGRVNEWRFGVRPTVLFAEDVDVDATVRFADDIDVAAVDDPVLVPVPDESPSVILIDSSPVPVDKPLTPYATKMRRNKRLKRRIKKIRAIERERRKRLLNEE